MASSQEMQFSRIGTGGAVFAIRTKQNEQFIYAVTKILPSHATCKLLDNGHPRGQLVALDFTLPGIDDVGVSLYPRAERYYREVRLRRQSIHANKPMRSNSPTV